MPFATHKDVGTSLMGFEKQAPEVPKSHLAHVVRKRKLGAPERLEPQMVQGKKAFDASGYKPDPNSAYAYTGGYGGAM